MEKGYYKAFINMDPLKTHSSNSFEDFNTFEEFGQASHDSFGQYNNTYFQNGQSSNDPFKPVFQSKKSIWSVF